MSLPTQGIRAALVSKWIDVFFQGIGIAVVAFLSGVLSCVLFLLALSRVAWYLLLSGMLCNTTARVANGGSMPVQGLSFPEGHWIPMTPATKVPFLCDIYLCGIDGRASIGDFMIVAGGMIMLLNFGPWVWRNMVAVLFAPSHTTSARKV